MLVRMYLFAADVSNVPSKSPSIIIYEVASMRSNCLKSDWEIEVLSDLQIHCLSQHNNLKYCTVFE